MGRVAQELGPKAVSLIREPGMHFVGVVPGLALQVLPTGGRSWILRAMVAGKRRDIGLGGYPAVTLAGAHEAARIAREKIKAGVDPVEERRAVRSKAAADRAAALTFDQCAARYIKAQAGTWSNDKSAVQWRTSLATYASPSIGAVLVRDVDVTHVLAVLEPIWSTKTETASRVRGRIETVLDWAAARGYRHGLNPARWRGHLDKTLPRPSKLAKPEHHPALPVELLPAYLARLRAAPGIAARCLEFVTLTAARTGEARGATWSEIDTEAALWRVPATRMKAGREHRVPLSPQVLKLLAELPRIVGTDLVFPAPRKGELSDMAISMTMRRINEADEGRWIDPKTGRAAVPHGMRSSFRDWAAERTNYPRELAEVALAHAIAGGTEAAYWRGDLLVKRREMMDAWGRFCYGASA